MMPRSFGLNLALAALACLAAASAAFAQGGYDTDPTREQFVAAADQKCKRANARSREDFEAVEKLVRKDKLKAAGAKLIEGEKVQLKLVGNLRKIDRPPADAKRIGKWLRRTEEAIKTSIGAGRDLKRKRIRAAAAGLEEADEQFARARRVVKDFGFRYCA